MVWNYRIVKTEIQGEIRHAIHGVFYGTGEEEIPENYSQEDLDLLGLSWTEDPITVATDEDPATLKETLLQMLKACDKPIVNGIEQKNS